MFLGMNKAEWRRLLLHTPHGAGIPVGFLWNPWIGAAWFLLILYYQTLEEVTIQDLSYMDVRGYMAGVPVGAFLWPFLEAAGKHYYAVCSHLF